MGNVIPTGSVFCLLGILRMSYVHTVKEYKIVQENTYALLKPILSVLGPSLRNDTSNDTWCICWCYCTILPSRPSTSALVTPRRRGDVRNNSRMLPSSAGRSMRNAPKSTNYILINKIILYKNKKVNKKGYNPRYWPPSTVFVHLENGVCSLGCSATAYVRIRYQQLERIRTAAPAGAIAVAYFAFRWLIRTGSLERR